MSVLHNQRASMKATWRSDPNQWQFYHCLINLLNIHPTDITRRVPVFQKTEKVPFVSSLNTHIWILLHALWPLAVHQLYICYTGRNFTTLTTALFYTIAFNINSIHQLRMMQHLGHYIGFFDGDQHERDQVPDDGVNKCMQALNVTTILRPSMAAYLSYSVSQPPTEGISLWLPLEMILYGIVLDFYFYWYHRSMHEVDWLWKFHRTHHLTKHPNPLLALYADGLQEIFDIAVMPLVTWATLRFCCGLPMTFFDWWICHEYVSFTELWGHSGLRAYFVAPLAAMSLLHLVDAELCTEDHDLHHRRGWKRSGNYGKQTRLWDRIFDTTLNRIETIPSNIDWNTRVALPVVTSPRA